jgi:hypothetical protein
MGIIKALTNDDMVSFLTIVFRNMFKRSLSAAGNLNEPLLIMANTLAAVMVRNHKEIAYVVTKENQYLSHLQEEVMLDLNGKLIKQFEWHEDFIWIAGHLKYFFTVDQKSFTDFAITLFKKVSTSFYTLDVPL